MPRKRTVGILAVTVAVAAAAVTSMMAGQVGSASAAAALDPAVAPGGNFNLSVWQLQLPTGSPGKPTTIQPAQLKGPNGFTNGNFFTDKTNGSMTFWTPEKGVTTPNSKFARSELREMNSNGTAADWQLPGTHRLSATVRVTQVPKSVAVGQVHLGSGGSTKPLLELYYAPSGNITLGIENSPAGGQTRHEVGNVPLNTQWSYVVSITGGNKINLQLNGGSTRTWTIPSSFKGYGMYFKAGSYNQSSSSSTTQGSKVKFFALNISHS